MQYNNLWRKRKEDKSACTVQCVRVSGGASRLRSRPVAPATALKLFPSASDQLCDRARAVVVVTAAVVVAVVVVVAVKAKEDKPWRVARSGQAMA